MACLRCNKEIHTEAPSILKKGWLCYEKDGLCLRVNPKPWIQAIGALCCKIVGHDNTDPLVCWRCYRMHPDWRERCDAYYEAIHRSKHEHELDQISKLGHQSDE